MTTPFSRLVPRGARTPAACQHQNSHSTVLDTYLPDVQRAMTSVGQGAKTYLPQSVAVYLRVSLLPPRVDSVATHSTSASLSDADSSHLTTAGVPHPALLSPAVFDDAPIVPAPLSRPRPSSHPSHSPPRPPCALPGASSPSSAHGSTPRPSSTESKFVEGIPSSRRLLLAPRAERGPCAESTAGAPQHPRCPRVPINPGLSSANGAPDVVASCAPQGYIAPRDGVAQGKHPHFRAAASEPAPPVPPKTDAPDLAPPPASPPSSPCSHHRRSRRRFGLGLWLRRCRRRREDAAQEEEAGGGGYIILAWSTA
ncbi:hypothetical protein FB451DRAFT_1557277 [Mycena latifolia]|nr:hypothetical protein FB451DRAFT_1557277 [Mycena latifolia]